MSAIVCPKCSYKRKATDSAIPDWQCPSCSIAYAKYQAGGPAPRSGEALARDSSEGVSAMMVLWIVIGIACAGYLGYRQYRADQAEKEKPAVVKAQGARLRAVPFREGQFTTTGHPAYYATYEAGNVVALRLKEGEVRALALLSGSAQVVMFGMSTCPYCAKARAIFKQYRVPYTELDIERDARAKNYEENVLGFSGYPLIVVGNHVMRGFNQEELIQSLKELYDI